MTARKFSKISNKSKNNRKLNEKNSFVDCYWHNLILHQTPVATVFNAEHLILGIQAPTTHELCLKTLLPSKTYLQMFNKSQCVRQAPSYWFDIFAKIAFSRNTVSFFRCDAKIIFEQKSIFDGNLLRIRRIPVECVNLFGGRMMILFVKTLLWAMTLGRLTVLFVALNIQNIANFKFRYSNHRFHQFHRIHCWTNIKWNGNWIFFDEFLLNQKLFCPIVCHKTQANIVKRTTQMSLGAVTVAMSSERMRCWWDSVLSNTEFLSNASINPLVPNVSFDSIDECIGMCLQVAPTAIGVLVHFQYEINSFVSNVSTYCQIFNFSIV